MKPSDRIKELESYLHSSESRSNAIAKYLDEEWEKNNPNHDCIHRFRGDPAVCKECGEEMK